jgi:hypothetical protein
VSENQSDVRGLSLELGPEVANIICDHCGHSFKSVLGFITKDDSAYSIYFATLQTGHDEIEASLRCGGGENGAGDRPQGRGFGRPAVCGGSFLQPLF